MGEKPKPDAPRIQQESHGPSSPNIVGDYNTVTAISVNVGRRLSEPQKLLLINAMSPHSQTEGKRLLWCMADDAEGIRLTMDFVDAFRRAGWDLPNCGFGQRAFQPAFGFVIQVCSWCASDPLPTVATDLISCLSSLGLGVTTVEQDPNGVLDCPLKLIVGFKP
jgi:hypothetical protein